GKLVVALLLTIYVSVNLLKVLHDVDAKGGTGGYSFLYCLVEACKGLVAKHLHEVPGVPIIHAILAAQPIKMGSTIVEVEYVCVGHGDGHVELLTFYFTH